jgi:hypothetical protein
LVDSWRANYGRLESLAVLNGGCLKDLVGRPVHVIFGKTGDRFDVFNVRPDLVVELAVRPSPPVCDDVRAGEAN